MNVVLKLAVTSVFATSSFAAMAQDHAHGAHAAHAAHAAAPAQQHALTDGEIKKIDKDSGKLTIRHGELKNLGMSAMTMTFRTKDAAMLDKVKVGDKVKFAADRTNGALTVTHLESVK